MAPVGFLLLTATIGLGEVRHEQERAIHGSCGCRPALRGDRVVAEIDGDALVGAAPDGVVAFVDGAEGAETGAAHHDKPAHHRVLMEVCPVHLGRTAHHLRLDGARGRRRGGSGRLGAAPHDARGGLRLVVDALRRLRLPQRLGGGQGRRHLLRRRRC
jgi:hypothetical protein